MWTCILLKLQANAAEWKAETDTALHRSADKMQCSHAVFMLAKPFLHLAICQGQLFHHRGKEIRALATFEQQDLGGGGVGGDGGEKAEEQLTNVIGLLASSHGA